jgi:hypothetical protein
MTGCFRLRPVARQPFPNRTMEGLSVNREQSRLCSTADKGGSCFLQPVSGLEQQIAWRSLNLTISYEFYFLEC